jgi:DNA-binding MarR family transcriptional regulator
MDYEIQLMELFHQIRNKIKKTLAPMFKEPKYSQAEVMVLFVMAKKKKSHVIELATIIGVPASTLTGILDRLVAQGFLEREPDPEDRRSLILRDTPKLHAFIRSLMAPIVDRLKEVFRAMPEKRLKRLIDDLKFVIDQLDHSESK